MKIEIQGTLTLIDLEGGKSQQGEMLKLILLDKNHGGVIMETSEKIYQAQCTCC